MSRIVPPAWWEWTGHARQRIAERYPDRTTVDLTWELNHARKPTKRERTLINSAGMAENRAPEARPWIGDNGVVFVVAGNRVLTVFPYVYNQEGHRNAHPTGAARGRYRMAQRGMVLSPRDFRDVDDE